MLNNAIERCVWYFTLPMYEDLNILYVNILNFLFNLSIFFLALRTWPVATTISHLVTRSDQIDDYKIPSSAQLATLWVWEEPMKFDPSRFLQNDINSEKESFDKNALYGLLMRSTQNDGC